LTTLGSVSDSGDGVIEAGSTGSRVEDTSGVTLEDSCVGFDGNGNNTLGNGGLKLGDRAGWDASVSLGVELGGSLVVARSLSGGVLVVRLKFGNRFLQEVEGVGLPSTVATV